MGFGYNRYALCLAIFGTLGGGVTTIGCGGGGGGGGVASTTAATTSSGSTTAPTSSSTVGGSAGPRLVSATFVDENQDQMVGKGDRVLAAFDKELAPLAGTPDPLASFELLVAGDSLGTGATLAAGTNAREVAIVLGDAPRLTISDSFVPALIGPGSPSGLNISLYNRAGPLKGLEGAQAMPAATGVDIGGALQAGFRVAADLVVPRGGHAAVALDDGRVLVVGGVAAGGKKDYVGEAELFDPVTNQWRLVSDTAGDAGRMKAGSVVVKMVKATATKMKDGTVLVCGGYGYEKKGLLGLGGEKLDTMASAFVFDPTTDTFRKVGDMNYPRHSHTATLMDDGRVLIAGGYNDSFWKSDKTQAPFEIYDPAKGKFEGSGSLFSRFKSKEPRMGHTATPIDGGTGILLAGGSHYSGGGLFGLIKPKLKMSGGSEVVRGTTTQAAGGLVAPRTGHTAATLSATNVLLAGGHTLNGTPVGKLELYDVATGQWSDAGDLSSARTGCEVAVTSGQALILGGTDGQRELAEVEVFDPATRTLAATKYTLGAARTAFAAVTLADGRVMVIGGMTGATNADGLNGQAIAGCELFSRQ